MRILNLGAKLGKYFVILSFFMEKIAKIFGYVAKKTCFGRSFCTEIPL